MGLASGEIAFVPLLLSHVSVSHVPTRIATSPLPKGEGTFFLSALADPSPGGRWAPLVAQPLLPKLKLAIGLGFASCLL